MIIGMIILPGRESAGCSQSTRFEIWCSGRPRPYAELGSWTARASGSPIGGWHGPDGAKKVNGRKRHVLVDTLGLLLRVRVTAGDVGDRDGAAMLLHDARGIFPRLRFGWVDGGYRGAFLD
jgi:hypothetical protein